MEQLAYQPELEQISRRTDDIMFNVWYLAENILDREAGNFLPTAETDVLEQNSTEITEADVHKFGATVYQNLDPELGQYVSLGAGTVDHADKGRDALDLEDLNNWFEYYRRDEEGIEERRILEPNINAGMRAGGIKKYISPSPTHHEVDPDVSISFGYDDRTMVRLQGLSPDGQTKIMKSFSVFGVPAEAWAAFLSAERREAVDPLALSVMQASGELPLEEGSFEEVLVSILNGVKNYLPEDEQASLEAQLDAFLQDQESLAQHVSYYAHEKLAFQKELALSLNGWARPAIMNSLLTVQDKLNQTARMELSKRMMDDGLYVDDYVASLLMKVNTVMTDNRAGLATHNERTIRRVASSIGLDNTLAMARTEQFIQQAAINETDATFMIRRNEQQLAESGASCSGGCPVEVVDLFSEKASTAREAGLKGTLYESKELDKNSKCSCTKNNRKAKVISDGKNVVCTTCGDYQVGGKRGSLKKAA